MSERYVVRAKRLQRIAKVSDALAKSAEVEVSDRRQVLIAEQQRLETVERYAGDYGAVIRGQEQAAQRVASLRLYREFSSWLSGLAQDQKNQVVQAEFLLEAAMEEAQGKRNFANALERAAEKSGARAAAETLRLEQKILDGLPRRGLFAALARGLHAR